MTLTKMNYCKYKKDKLANTMNEFSKIKLEKIEKFCLNGYTEEQIIKILNLSPASFYIIENREDYSEIYAGELALCQELG